MGLQPLLPGLAIGSTVFACEHVVGNRLVALLLFDVLDLQPHRNRLPRLQPQIDDLDFAGTARLGRLLKGLVNHGARGVGIVDAEDRHRLVVLRQLVDEVPGGW
jgi:hypothetical protein